MVKINKHEIMATIGFLGNTALVDKKLKHTIKKLSLEQLLAKGYYKEAIRWAMLENDSQKKQVILDFFQQQHFTGSFEYLAIEFGVEVSAFDKIQKVKAV